MKDIIIKPLVHSNEIKNTPHPDLPKTALRGIIIGASGSGKSVLLQNLFGREDLYRGIYQQKHTIILSPSLDAFDPFPMLKTAIKIDDTSKFPGAIWDVMAEVRKQSAEHGSENIPPVLFIVDDCSTVKGMWGTNGPMDTLFLTGRNYNISVVVIAHRLNLLSRNIKLNINFACLFPTNNFSELESFIVQFVGRELQPLLRCRVNKAFQKEHNFVFLNTDLPRHKRLRDGFHHPLISDAEIEHLMQQEEDKALNPSKRTRKIEKTKEEQS